MGAGWTIGSLSAAVLIAALDLSSSASHHLERIPYTATEAGLDESP